MTVRVLCVDDSIICQVMLQELLEADGDIRVTALASDGRAALAIIQRELPDVVTMDLHMPGMDGMAAIEEIMARHPVPILVVTSEPGAPGSTVMFEAVQRGALDLAARPAQGDRQAAAALRTRIRTLANVKVVKHLPSPTRLLARAGAAAAPHPTPHPGLLRGCTLVGLGASAGGPAAVATLLHALPADFPGCIALVQHLPVGFAQPFVRFLSERTALNVRMLTQSTRPQPGTVVVAPDGQHLKLNEEGLLVAAPGSPQEGHCPSVDALFYSLAQMSGPHAVGVLLTGIGRDGAAGLKAMRDKGALTLVQDQHSSAVWGMPRAAVELGAATRVLPLEQLAEALRAGLALGRQPRAR